MNNEMQVDDVHVVIGTLLEAAICDQDAIHKAIERLNDVEKSVMKMANGLPHVVASEVDVSIKGAVNCAADTLVKRFDNANIQAEHAAAAYKDAAKFSLRRIVIPALGITTICSMAILFVAWMLIPSLTELQERREEKDILEQRIAWLEKKGAKSDFTNCQISKNGKKTRLCVRLDPDLTGQWEGGYRIVADK